MLAMPMMISRGVAIPATDPYFANVGLLCHFNGADASTTFTDVKGKTLTPMGNAKIVTAQSKFGGSSGFFDGSGDRITTPDSADWDFAAGAYTVELFVRLNAKTTNQTFITHWHGDVAQSAWAFYLEGSTLKMRVAVGFSVVDIGATWSPSTGVWYHLCVERNSSGFTRVYVDGVVIASGNGHNLTFNNSAVSLAIGAIGPFNSFPTFDFNGWMDELRITKGVARYNGVFTPPSAPFPDA